MARKHVINYFLEVENQYNEMMSLLPVYKKMAQEGALSPEDYETNLKYIDRLRENYERIAFIILLLNKPQRKYTKQWYKALKFASKEAILDENKDCLVHLKETIKKGKENHE